MLDMPNYPKCNSEYTYEGFWSYGIKIWIC